MCHPLLTYYFQIGQPKQLRLHSFFADCKRKILLSMLQTTAEPARSGASDPALQGCIAVLIQIARSQKSP